MDKQTRELFKKKGVVSVGKGRKVVNGIDTGRAAWVVGVRKKLPWTELDYSDLIPRTIGDKVTDVIEVGDIILLDKEVDEIPRTGAFRPILGGAGCGHRDVTVGTLGMWVYRDNKWMWLSNNHVLWNVNKANKGDPCYQPGVYDGGFLTKNHRASAYDYVEIKMSGLSDCQIGNMVAWVPNIIARILHSRTRLTPRQEAGENLVDCALARSLFTEDRSPYIIGCGIPRYVIEPEVGMLVKKSGRTTGLTHGEISQVEATVQVNMGGTEIAYFIDQIVISGTGFSDGGDSGSVILTDQEEAPIYEAVAGLLFAGGQGTTIANRFFNVAKALNFVIWVQ